MTPRTRDGSFALGDATHEAFEAPDERVQVTMTEASRWARDNAVPIEPDGRLSVGKLNARRAQLGLALFKVVKGPAAGADGTLPPPVQRDLDAKPDGWVPPDEAPPVVDLYDLPDLPSAPVEPLLVGSLDELLDLVGNFSGTKTGLVTPETAGYLLELNTANRPLAPEGVSRFVRILQSGAWKLTGEPVIISSAGIVNDGQHRLHAIRKAGIPALCDVRFGIERDAFDATGTAARRTAGNVLHLAGLKNYTLQAAIARQVALYDQKRMAQGGFSIENAAIRKMCEAEPGIGKVASFQATFKFTPAKHSGIGMAMVVAARHVPWERVTTFGYVVNTGLGTSESDPAYTLHTALVSAMTRKKRLSQLEIAIMAGISWNAWIEGRSLRRIEISPNHRTSAGFPRITAG